MNNKKTLYVSDMDGTLLNSRSVLSEKTVSKLNKLIADGAMFTVATARTPATVVELMKGVDARLPFIVMAGCAMWNSHTRQYDSARLISNETIEQLLPVFERNGNHPFIYCKKGNQIIVHHTKKLTGQEKEFIEPRVKTELKRLALQEKLSTDASHDGVMLIFSMGKFNELRDIADEIDKQKIDCSYNCYHDIFEEEEGFIDLYVSGTTKAAAIKQLAEQTGAERIVVFGDNLNDIPMMHAADWSVAVENAFDEVKHCADEIIGSNDKDAVAEWIEKDYRKQMDGKQAI